MTLDEFNHAADDTVLVTLLACCDAPGWASSLLAGRPYPNQDALLAEADRAARDLAHTEVRRALAAHPRIGENAHRDGTEAAWSRQEQSNVSGDEQTRQALVNGNRAYEQRFGHVFLICATGLTSEQILGALRARLGNDEATESAVIADELRKIAVLRLSKALAA